MIYIIIAITLFLVMAFFPIGFSIFVLRNKKSEKLIITNTFLDDPDYFKDLYSGIFKNKWRNKKAGNLVDIPFKDNEHIIEADYESVYPQVCEDIVYAEYKDFIPPKGVSFTKNIYANENAYLIDIKSIVGIYSKKNILLGSGIDVVLWVDADGTVAVEEDCNLGIMTSSDKKIFIGGHCIFNKLYAPIIYFDCSFDFINNIEKDSLTNDNKFREVEIIRNVKYIDDEIADGEMELNKTIISKYDITIVDGMVIKGNIRSHKSIKVGDNAVIYGNIFAEHDIYMGQNSRVLGNVFTQGDFNAERGVIIGQKDKIKSIIARGKIFFNNNCVVYGYVDCEDIGRVLKND